MGIADAVLLREYNPAIPGEEGYVLSTWLRDLRDADSGGLPDEFWFPAHRAYVQSVLGNPTARILVATPSDGGDEILGYIAGFPAISDTTGVLEWVHVRKQFRRRGLARLLLQFGGIPAGSAARWSTRLSRDRLRVLPRGRQLRSAKPSP